MATGLDICFLFGAVLLVNTNLIKGQNSTTDIISPTTTFNAVIPSSTLMSDDSSLLNNLSPSSSLSFESSSQPPSGSNTNSTSIVLSASASSPQLVSSNIDSASMTSQQPGDSSLSSASFILQTSSNVISSMPATSQTSLPTVMATNNPTMSTLNSALPPTSSESSVISASTSVLQLNDSDSSVYIAPSSSDITSGISSGNWTIPQSTSTPFLTSMLENTVSSSWSSQLSFSSSSTSSSSLPMITSSSLQAATSSIQASGTQTMPTSTSNVVSQVPSPTSNIADSTTMTIQPSSTIGMTSSSQVTGPLSTQASTTTTPRPTTTTTLPDTIEQSVDSSNIVRVDTKLTLNNCTGLTKSSLREQILGTLSSVEEVREVIVKQIICGSTIITRRRKRATTETGTADFTIGISYETNSSIVAGEIEDNILQDGNFSLTDSTSFRSAVAEKLGDPCSTDVCDNYYGYDCFPKFIHNGTVECKSKCSTKTCSNGGTCSIIVDSLNDFGTKCVCKTEEYYTYEGNTCENKRMKWELAVAIAGGAAGGVIVILIFALVICGCCKSKEDQYAYRRNSYEPMSTLIGKQPAYYRNEDNRMHQTGFNNMGYDDDPKYTDYENQRISTNGGRWNPDESKDTYAKIREQMPADNNFQIKRPTISGSRPDSTTERKESEDGILIEKM